MPGVHQGGRRGPSWWCAPRGRWLVALSLTMLAGSGAAQSIVTSVDPMTIADDDFARRRDPELWRGLEVRRIVLTEGGTTWRFWRISNLEHPAGPLWVVTHDNENATFAAALTAVKSWGGVVMVVDTGPVDTRYNARFNSETTGAPIDPNRHFVEAYPGYVAAMLDDLAGGPRLIIALHTNAADFDPVLSDCPATRPGRGAISVGLCNARYQPQPAKDRRWPFDDDDSLVLVPWQDPGGRASAYCSKPLVAADMNLVFEHVVVSDGSLSNYAIQHGLPYLNVETEERGSDPAGIALARDRLVRMIDQVMGRCADISGITLRPPRQR